MKLIALFFLLCSCASKENLVQKAEEKNFVKKIYPGENFDIFTLQKIANNKDDLHIYIEGDGFAYVDRTMPSLDPTPRKSLLIDLILQDKSKNILYIARPCQFVMAKKCEEKYWTSQRFSKEVVEAIAEVIANFSKQKQILIGYSGGANIINHLANEQTKKIITIAGNLDLQEFVRFHKISDLEEEKINYQKLAKIPQFHFVASDDKIIPLNIFYAYVNKLPDKSLVVLKIIPNSNHYNISPTLD